MSDAANDYTVQIVMSVLGGFILIMSEILPFIKSIKSNGIIELLVNIAKSFLRKNSDIPEDEESLLHNDTLNISSQNNSNVNSISNKIDALSTSVMNISYSLNHYITEAQNARQLKLQSVELYELNYIINYIKVNYPKKMFQTKFLSKSNKQLLISQGYVIDYDSQNDTHTIKW